MSSIIAAMDTVSDLTNSVWTLITGNPLLTVFLAASLVSVGVGVFVAVKNAARS